MSEKPNVLYLNSHDTGRFIQPYGALVDTPHLQRFAEDAVVFRQAFCCNPTCSPSRAALLTGTYPHQCGMLGLAHLGWRLNDYREHWIHALHEAGYTSYFTGGQHIGDTADIGYHHIVESFGEHARGPCAADLLASKRMQEPFYLEVGFANCHRRGQNMPEPHPNDDPRWLPVPATLPDHPDIRREFGGLRTMARELDDSLGMIFRALEDSGLADNTIVVCTTDHGIDMPNMKCTLRDDGIGVFLMIRGPKGSAWRGGQVIEPMISQLDVFPTLCSLTGAAAPDRLEGRSLCPLVEGQTDRHREEIHAELNYHATYQPMRCVRTDRWKYIRRFCERPTPLPPNQAPNPSRSVWELHGWPQRPEPREELFDLVFDPGEHHNLAADAEHAAVLEDMRRRMSRWMDATEDPIRHGHIPLPGGGRIVDPDDPSNQGQSVTADPWNQRLQQQGF